MDKQKGHAGSGENGMTPAGCGDLTDQELRRVARAFADTYRIAPAARRAGIDPSRCARLPDQSRFRRLVDSAVLERIEAEEGRSARRRVAAEYEKIAFADVEDGLVKPADKIRALGEYLRLSGGESEAAPSGLTVVYGYEAGDSDG